MVYLLYVGKIPYNREQIRLVIGVNSGISEELARFVQYEILRFNEINKENRWIIKGGIFICNNKQTQRIIHSGGATGADQAFGDIGTHLGYEVIHHTFKNHKVSGEGAKKFHTYEDSEEAYQPLEDAADALKRQLPDSYTDEYMLLIRDYYQVVLSDYIIAIAPFEDGDNKIVSEGTGWTVQLCITMKKTVYVFDDGKTNCWYQSRGGQAFEKYYGRIPSIGQFAGIGSRKITDRGFAEIKKILSQDLADENKYYLKLKDIFSLVNDDLKFAETKNTFLVPFCAANILWLFSNFTRVQEKINNEYLVIIYFLYMGFPMVACVISIFGSMPNRNNYKNKTKESLLDKNLLFWRDVSLYDNQKYLADFIRKYEILEMDLVKRIVLVSKIANTKYTLYCLASSAAIAGIVGTISLAVLTSIEGYLEMFGLQVLFGISIVLLILWVYILLIQKRDITVGGRGY